MIEGAARFTDAATVAVGDSSTIRARRFVIATGSSPAVPPIPGLTETPYLTNETIFELKRCPEHLIIIGAGPIGLELAQAHRRLGAKVTVLEAATPLAKDDPECAAIVLAQLAREGVAIRAGVKVTRVAQHRRQDSGRHRTSQGEETIEGSDLLIATGRRPNVDGLDLEAAGITYDQRGITVDKGLKTSNKQVYAIGDVAGGALHPRRQLSRRHRDPERAVPPARQGERRDRSPGSPSPTRSSRMSASPRRRRASATRRSACCAGPITRTTARRPSARRTATSRSSPRRTAAFSARPSSARMRAN